MHLIQSIVFILSLLAVGMATSNDTTQIGSLLKRQYAKGVIDAYSFMAPLAGRLIKYDYQEAGTGEKYEQPVDLVLEHSMTAAAGNTLPTYLAINAGIMQSAQSLGAQIFGRSSVTYEMLSRAKSKGTKAFEAAVTRVSKRVATSHLKRLEIDLITGGRGVAAGGTISGTSTTRALVVSDETWSAGRFAGMVNATLTIVRADNSTAVAPVAGAAGSCSIASIDMKNKTLNITGNATDLTDLDTYWPLGAILYFESFNATTSMSGLDAWANMSGTWFNIATGTYDLWNPNVYSTSTGVISFGKIVEAADMIAPFGQVQKLVAVVPTRAYSVLNTDLAALRQIDSSYKTSKIENGFEGITFHTSVGMIEILPHPFQSDGKIHIFAPDEALRTGSSDIEFIDRGGDKIVLESATTPSGEMRTMSNQQLFLEQPRHLVVLSGITYG